MLFNWNYFGWDDYGLIYGNYGGINYSAGVEGGRITADSPPPVDALDTLFYWHDYAYQTSNNFFELREADFQLLNGMYSLASDSWSDCQLVQPLADWLAGI